MTDIPELGIKKAEINSCYASDITYLREMRLKLMDAQLDKRVKREDLKTFPSLETLDNLIEKRTEHIRAAEILMMPITPYCCSYLLEAIGRLWFQGVG